MGERDASLVPQSHSPGKHQKANDCQRLPTTGNHHQERTGVVAQTQVPRLGKQMLERYRTRCASLFIFLQRTDVPADNNACERALRPSVIHRKVMGSFRSEWGAHAYAALTTVLNTAKRNRQNAFQKLIIFLGTPVLPFFHSEFAV
jgi:hypothetical protein